MSATCVSDVLIRLDDMAFAGSPPADVAHEVEAIAAGWWAFARQTFCSTAIT